MKCLSRPGIAVCLFLFAFILFLSCRKEQKPEAKKNAPFEVLENEFARQQISKNLITPFNDSLNLIYMPDWQSSTTAQSLDSQSVTYIPLYARLQSKASKAFYTIGQNSANRLLIAYKNGIQVEFKTVTYVDQIVQSQVAKGIRQDTTLKVLVDDLKGNSFVSEFQKYGLDYQRKPSSVSRYSLARSSSDMKRTPQICYNVCTWGYYCAYSGYHVTVTVSADGFCASPNTTAEPCQSPWTNPDNVPLYPPWNVTYTEVRCVTGPPPPNGNIDDDPAHRPIIGGTYTSKTVPSRDFPTLPDVTDDYKLTCPSNFTFVSVTEHDLWQEAAITNAWVNLIYINQSTQTYIAKKVTIPIIYFGLAYYDGDGKLLLSKKDAANISADAMNWAEWRVRKAFKANPNATTAKLQDIWVEMTDFYMRQMSINLGIAGRSGSLHPAQPVIPRPYTACY